MFKLFLFFAVVAMAYTAPTLLASPYALAGYPYSLGSPYAYSLPAPYAYSSGATVSYAAEPVEQHGYTIVH